MAKRTKRLWRTKESFIVDTLAILALSLTDRHPMKIDDYGLTSAQPKKPNS